MKPVNLEPNFTLEELIAELEQHEMVGVEYKTSTEWREYLGTEDKPLGIHKLDALLISAQKKGKLLVKRRAEMDRSGRSCWKPVYSFTLDTKR